MLHRRYIIRNFLDILNGYALDRLIFKQQQVGERGLGTFDSPTKSKRYIIYKLL